MPPSRTALDITPAALAARQRFRLADLHRAFFSRFRLALAVSLAVGRVSRGGREARRSGSLGGGGHIAREYGLGRRRTDLLVTWQHAGGKQRVVVELKLLHKGLEQTIGQGLQQTADYMDTAGAPEGHLLVFDRTSGRSWDEKVFRRSESYEGKTISVWGM